MIDQTHPLPGSSLTLSQVIWPAQSKSYVRNTVLVLSFSAFLGVCAHLEFPLPFAPVPVTMQTFGVLLAAIVLGPKLGVAVTVAYMLEGLAGLPVFAPIAGETSAPLTAILKPSFGYIVGFIPAAWVAGTLACRAWDRKWLPTAAAMLSASVVIYLFGATWLAAFIGARNAMIIGVLPFIPGDIAKALLAAALLPTAWRLTNRNQS